MSDRYEEYYAKVILEQLCPNLHKELIVIDKPDLINYQKLTGIEVTTAWNKNEAEIRSLWLKTAKPDCPYKEKNIDRLNQLGAEYNSFLTMSREYASGDVLKTPSKCIFDSFVKKVEKLNEKGYKRLERYELCIMSNIDLDDGREEQMLEFFLKYNTKELKFSYMYVITQDKFHEFDLENKKLDSGKSEKYYNLQGKLARIANSLRNEAKIK